MATKCNICGGQEFKPAPGGRLSRTGKLPVCISCGSLERHRIFREIFEAIKMPEFITYSCLQFSRDPSVEKGWFKSCEVSIFNKKNSIDIQKIERPDEKYDVIIANHVLEHVLDYRAAIAEIVRVVSRRGFAFLSFPAPYYKQETKDWGYPKEDQHMHYRIFGRDIENVFQEICPEASVVALSAEDPVTGQADLAYLVTKSNNILSSIRQAPIDCRLIE